VFFEKNVRGEEKRKKNSGFIWDWTLVNRAEKKIS
jgi:hypothetical protein